MSHCAVCCNKQFVPSGCQVPVLTDSGSAIICGETENLDIITQMKEIFENKMKQIDTEAGGDCASGLQAKLHLQQEWIRSLTEQNEMLVAAVKELETEATKRVSKLEEKLENSVQIGSENSVENDKVKAVEEEAGEERLSVDAGISPSYRKGSDASVAKSLEEKLEDACAVIVKKDSDEASSNKRLHELENELEKALQESENERKKRNQEISNLKETIFELEKALQNAQCQGEKLQRVVYVYENSVNVLEAYEEDSKIEKSHQITTIGNLEDTLLAAKYLINDLQLKTNNELQGNVQLIDELHNKLLLVTHECAVLRLKLQTISRQAERMRDQILDLEVENFGYIQDLEIFEKRLSRYQEIFRNHEESSTLKMEIARLQLENERQCNLNIAFTQQIVSMGAELEAACKNSANSEELKKAICEQQQANDELQKELKKSREELIQETRINEIDGERVEELTHSLDQKAEELLQSKEKCSCTQKQLDKALNENNDLQNEVSVLMNRTACYEQQNVLSEERTDYCQNEIESCNRNLHCLNEKLNIMKDLLHQKDEQYSQLETYYYVQTNALECSKKICEEGKAHYESDIADLKHTIQELNEKLMKADNNYHSLHEDYKKSQILIVDASHRESKMQQDYVKCSKELSEKVQASEAEEARVRDYARQVESQNSVLRNDLNTLQRQIELLKAQLTRLKSAAASQVKGAQEEINNLKNELNKIIQQHSKMKSENDSLRLQISHFQAYEQQNRVTGEQLDQCLRELHNIQVEKQRVDAMNQKMLKEFKGLQEAYKNMDRDHQRLSQSVISIELDLAVTKSSRDELCLESRNVINNVQSWLQYQRLINEQLKVKLTDNYLLINSLESELSYLDSENNCPCKERQRGGSSRSTAFFLNQQIQKPNINVDVHETPTPCTTLTSSTNDWYTFTDSEEESIQEIDLPSLWVRKVESITQVLQKSNDYWKSQMLENDYVVTRDQ